MRTRPDRWLRARVCKTGPWAGRPLLLLAALLLGLVHSLVARRVGELIAAEHRHPTALPPYYYNDHPPPATLPHLLLPASVVPRTMSSTPAVLLEAARVAREFDYPATEVQRGVQAFISQMQEGLSRQGATLSQIPTYVTAVPNGTEKVRALPAVPFNLRDLFFLVPDVLTPKQGLYLAVDLGGTNFRVCSVELHGDTTFSLTQSKVTIPRELMVASSAKELFRFLAKQIEAFLQAHHNEHFQAHKQRRQTGKAKDQYTEEEIFDLGFTFSFPVNQFGINKGTLIRWTKGFNVPDAVGKDVCAMLQEAIDELGLPVRVAALVNDTVGTLMARSYSSPGKTGTLLGAIFGTGTNGAYVEKVSNIPKMQQINGGTAFESSTGEMVINTEWGSFDNHLSVLPNTVYDRELDAESVNPGVQMFEKRVSGMFLGEILRRALLSMHRNPAVNLFRAGDGRSSTSVAADSALYKQWGIDTSFLSLVEADTTPDLMATRDALKRELGVESASLHDCRAVKEVAHAIGKRAARLSAVPLAGILISTGRLETDEVVDIGVDGSLVEFYPNFVEYIREALREVPEIGEAGERKVRIGIAKDGSGVGAALIALVASKELEAQGAL